MPERWEREVGKLARLEAPPSTSRRIADGPHGDGMPPAPHRGQRVVAGVVAFVVFGAAAALVVGAFRGSGDTAAPVSGDATKVVIQLTSSDQGPRADLVFGDETAASQYGSYCWNGTTKCVDTYLVPFAASDFVKVPSGTPIVVVHDDSLDRALVWTERGDDPNDVDLGLVQPATTIEGQPGRYVLAVKASWPLGNVQFFFPIEVMNSEPVPTPSAGLVATLTAPTDGTAPSLVLSYGEHERSFFMQGGSWPGVDGFLGPIQAFDEPIGAGTVFRIEGDANRVMAEIQADGASNPSDLDLTGGSATLPGEPGSYQLTFKGVWDAGVAVFPIWIHVVDASGTPSPAGEPVPTTIDTNGATAASNQPSPPSASPASVTVPDVVGLTVNDALRLLHDAGLNAVGTWTPGSETSVGEDVVVSQDPPAGAEVAASTPVKLDAGAP
jgi:PASTA domain